MFGQKKIVLVVEGMMCEHCAAHVEDAVKKIAGAKAAKVDLKSKTVTVKAANEISREAFEKAIADAGYKLVEVRD